MPQYVKVSLPNDLSLVLGTNTNTISKYDFFFFFFFRIRRVHSKI